MHDLDPYRTARLLIDAHGARLAWQRVAVRLAELVGDPDAQAIWVSVLEAVDELTMLDQNGQRPLS